MTQQSFIEALRTVLPSVTDECAARLCSLQPLYGQWNERINVISRKDMDEFYLHHVLHSLSIAAHLGEGLDGRVLDLGTGGGFPGIPLAVFRPQAHFVLCDSVGKKTKVAQAVADALDLKNVEVVNARAETLPGGFDWVVSRAVAPLDTVLGWVKGKWTKGVICLKGGDLADELAAATRRFRLDGRISATPVTNYVNDPYFNEKYLVQVRP